MIKEQLFLQAEEYLNKWYKVPAICMDMCSTVHEDRISYQTISVDIEELDPTFSQKLFDLIRTKGISEQDCYKNANLDRRLFSKIRSNDDYQPSKNTVFALIFGLKLDLKEAIELLDAAGYSISHSLKMDVLIEFLIIKKVYDINTVNEVLYKYNCPLLGNVKE